MSEGTAQRDQDSRKTMTHQGSPQTEKEKQLKMIKMLDDHGIVHGMRSKSTLDEAPSAYKDITTVMENQTDLVKIAVELTPLAVIKG